MTLPTSATRLAGSIVLVVDDHEPSTRAWALALNLAGAYPLLAPTVANANSFIHLFGPRLTGVVLDYILPDGDASEITQELKKDACHPAIVLVTAIDREIASAAERRLGADQLLLKPFAPSMLIEALVAAIDARRSCPAARIAAQDGGQELDVGLHRTSRRGRPAGQKLRVDIVLDCRRHRGWTQSDLAAQAGVTVRTLSQAERGRPVSTRTIAAIARALEISPERLIS